MDSAQLLAAIVVCTCIFAVIYTRDKRHYLLIFTTTCHAIVFLFCFGYGLLSLADALEWPLDWPSAVFITINLAGLGTGAIFMDELFLDEFTVPRQSSLARGTVMLHYSSTADSSCSLHRVGCRLPWVAILVLAGSNILDGHARPHYLGFAGCAEPQGPVACDYGRRAGTTTCAMQIDAIMSLCPP